MGVSEWVDLGPIDELKKKPVQEVTVGDDRAALSYVDGKFGAISGTCVHAGGPMGEGSLLGGDLVCPWHQWKFDFKTGVCLSIPTLSVACYPVEVVGDEIRVGL